MLDHRRRRWAGVVQMLYKCFVFAVIAYTHRVYDRHTVPVRGEYKTFVYHLYNVGPALKTLGRRCTNVIQMFCVCRGHDTLIQCWLNTGPVSQAMVQH